MSRKDDLKIRSVELTDFRSYHSLTVHPSGQLTVIVGPNASGKTNLLEAIHLTTSGSSFRRPSGRDLIRRDARSARVYLEAESDEGLVLDVVVLLDGNTRKTVVNGKQIRRRSELASRLPSVVFTPDDLQIIKGPAEARRDAVDEIGEGLSSAYGALRKEYARILRQRNTLLKERKGQSDDLASWTERLASVGGRLAHHRASLVQKMSEHASMVYSQVAEGETLDILYEDSYGMNGSDADAWGDPARIEEAIRQTLERRSREEERRGITLAGPQRDDIAFKIDKADARSQASQGQQRTVALSWKVAELRVVQEVTGRRPVLLLDDVMSELDRNRRAALTAYVKEGMQTFITTTTLDYFQKELLEGALVIRTGADEAE